MGNTDYTRAFANVAVQRNVMAFVGNGFDIQALQDYGARADTRYAHFYDFLTRRHFDPNNVILHEMKERKDAGRKTGATSRELFPSCSMGPRQCEQRYSSRPCGNFKGSSPSSSTRSYPVPSSPNWGQTPLGTSGRWIHS